MAEKNNWQRNLAAAMAAGAGVVPPTPDVVMGRATPARRAAAGGAKTSVMHPIIGPALDRVVGANKRVMDWSRAVSGMQPTPQERALAFVDTVLRGPVTMREAQAVSGMLPAPAKPQTAKDTLFGQYGSALDSAYRMQIASIQSQLTEGKTDDAGARKAAESASKEYLQMLGGVLGANGLMLPPSDPED